MPPFVAYEPPPEGRTRRGVTFTPAERNVLAEERIDVAQAASGVPDPIRDGETPARPARRQIYTALAIAPYLAVMRDDFWFPIEDVGPGQVAAMPRGRQLPWVERQNIAAPPAVPYGTSQAPFVGADDPQAVLLKSLMGANL